ncbi:hypothetical protein TrRE_jg9103 [Triparma retinervis]|uniref:Uncharacterized protein n=1 Tax=Triparma retinervis TaxID=2557542 RepID=A0A9W7EA20_9STRA|nr:hypothetical protein TrRE_jg9103 [Triparma retinervis]
MYLVIWFFKCSPPSAFFVAVRAVVPASTKDSELERYEFITSVEVAGGALSALLADEGRPPTLELLLGEWELIWFIIIIAVCPGDGVSRFLCVDLGCGFEGFGCLGDWGLDAPNP